MRKWNKIVLPGGAWYMEKDNKDTKKYDPETGLSIDDEEEDSNETIPRTDA